MSQYDLFSAWFRVADWCAYNLAKDGHECLVLAPLGKFPKAAASIVRASATSANYRHRKIGAMLAGWTRDAEPSLLDELFRGEADRDAGLSPTDPRRLESQSVVEDIVFAATRWARDPKLSGVALALLARIVERTIGGEYWNTSSYAMTTLMRHSASGADELLARFQSFALGAAPSHAGRPSLVQERTFAQQLVAGNPKTLALFENMLDDQERTLETKLDENSQSAINDLCDAARRFEET